MTGQTEQDCDTLLLAQLREIFILIYFLQYGPFLTVNQSMFTENEAANQWHCRAHYNLCPTLQKRTCAFCL